MKLRTIQDLTIIDGLKPLRGYKPITTVKVSRLKVPSESELILLSANLLYQGSQIIRGTSHRTGNLSADRCSFKALEIMSRLDDYENKFVDMLEFKKIRKDFKLNGLYK